MIDHDVEGYEIQDDGGLLFSVVRTASGGLSGKVRVYGHVLVDGVEYEYDREVRVAMKKVTHD
jgi:hypothetical protein